MLRSEDRLASRPDLFACVCDPLPRSAERLEELSEQGQIRVSLYLLPEGENGGETIRQHPTFCFEPCQQRNWLYRNSRETGRIAYGPF